MCLQSHTVSLQHFQDPADTKNSGEDLHNQGTVQHTTAQNTHTHQVQLWPQTGATGQDANLLPLNYLRYYFAEHKTRLTNAASIRKTSSTEQSGHSARFANTPVRVCLPICTVFIMSEHPLVLHSLKCAYTDSTRVELTQ